MKPSLYLLPLFSLLFTTSTFARTHGDSKDIDVGDVFQFNFKVEVDTEPYAIKQKGHLLSYPDIILNDGRLGSVTERYEETTCSVMNEYGLHPVKIKPNQQCTVGSIWSVDSRSLWVGDESITPVQIYRAWKWFFTSSVDSWRAFWINFENCNGLQIVCSRPSYKGDIDSKKDVLEDNFKKILTINP